MLSFSDSVKKIVQGIPKGKVMTYNEVARMAGNPKASRAVANIMSRNYDLKIPCHRVIKSDGTLGGYNRGGTEAKFKLLKNEGYELK